MSRLPSLFLSHGSPMMSVEDSAARSFLAGLGDSLDRPRAILMASAHWCAGAPMIGGCEAPETIHDFGGFPRELYDIRYEPPGSAEIAGRVVELLAQNGVEADIDDTRGLDHGAWVPLMLMYPQADIPVAQIATQPHLGPAHHYALGAALSELRDDGVLIIGSGNLTHNLGEMRRGEPDGAPNARVAEFTDWVFDGLSDGRLDDLLNYRRLAPHAVHNHPSDEHFLPLYTALGADGGGAVPERPHQSYSYGALAMDAYAFK
jgi:4,5-DOPA dioxygenase extradiol